MKAWRIALIIFGIVFLVGISFLIYSKFFRSEQEENGAETSEEVAIPDKVLSNKFGFLSGGEPENPFVGEVGGAWIRPHPGSFLWDSMQKSEGSEIDFTSTDEEITVQQKQNYGTLVTLWPFAEWDQLNHEAPEACEVSENDEFLYKPSGKRGEEYIPLHRCNPQDWTEYSEWVKAVVERYDGDGINDMPGLEIPVKYWEVMNEPDLSQPEPFEPEEDSSTLDFYMEDSGAYALLLINTNESIKEADPEAKVLIAGAAGGNEEFIGFYEKVLENTETHDAFDIGNIHCISNDQTTHDFNVGVYKELLESFGLDKPIWVTEAESMVSDDVDLNASSTFLSTENAIALGAEKIFYTRYDFEIRGDLNDRPFQTSDITKTIDGDDPTKAYQEIIESVE